MLQWIVYVDNINKGEIESFNIFWHRRFMYDIRDFMKKNPDVDKETFAQELRSSLTYCFWSKTEWEIQLCPLFGTHRYKEKKIDVYDQIALNFDVFVDYCWNRKDEIKKWKE